MSVLQWRSEGKRIMAKRKTLVSDTDSTKPEYLG